MVSSNLEIIEITNSSRYKQEVEALLTKIFGKNILECLEWLSTSPYGKDILTLLKVKNNSFCGIWGSLPYKVFLKEEELYVELIHTVGVDIKCIFEKGFRTLSNYALSKSRERGAQSCLLFPNELSFRSHLNNNASVINYLINYEIGGQSIREAKTQCIQDNIRFKSVKNIRAAELEEMCNAFSCFLRKNNTLLYPKRSPDWFKWRLSKPNSDYLIHCSRQSYAIMKFYDSGNAKYLDILEFVGDAPDFNELVKLLVANHFPEVDVIDISVVENSYLETFITAMNLFKRKERIYPIMIYPLDPDFAKSLSLTPNSSIFFSLLDFDVF